jgi:hypothetical protein
MKKERQEEIQFNTKFGGKTSLGPNYFTLTKISFPVTCLTPPYCVKTGYSHHLVTTWLYK